MKVVIFHYNLSSRLTRYGLVKIPPCPVLTDLNIINYVVIPVCDAALEVCRDDPPRLQES